MSLHKDKNPEYVLQVGKQAAANLDLQHEIFKEDTFSQLRKAGLSEGMTVWDIACGSGIMTEYLAEQVGPNGTVYALDISKEQLKTAQARIEKSGHKNVEFILEDINNLDTKKYQQADVIHSSFILMHLPNTKKAIEVMSSLLKPGGVLSMHESSFGKAGKDCGPDIEQLYELFIEYGKVKGVDYDLGKKIPKICKDLKTFDKVEHIEKDYETTKQVKQLVTSRLEEAEDSMVKSEVVTAEKYAYLKNNVISFLQTRESNKCDFTKQQHYILAYKATENSLSGKSLEHDDF
ncbi:class I SAM-dependent methyltransferase [bacterium]|nr:class I SAM-dependent methyltransferase [bacterium]